MNLRSSSGQFCQIYCYLHVIAKKNKYTELIAERIWRRTTAKSILSKLLRILPLQCTTSTQITYITRSAF